MRASDFQIIFALFLMCVLNYFMGRYGPRHKQRPILEPGMQRWEADFLIWIVERWKLSK